MRDWERRLRVVMASLRHVFSIDLLFNNMIHIINLTRKVTSEITHVIKIQILLTTAMKPASGNFLYVLEIKAA